MFRKYLADFLSLALKQTEAGLRTPFLVLCGVNRLYFSVVIIPCVTAYIPMKDIGRSGTRTALTPALSQPHYQ